MNLLLRFIALVFAISGLIIGLCVFLLPLYYVWTRNEPLYLLLFIVTPFIAAIIVQVFLAISETFAD